MAPKKASVGAKRKSRSSSPLPSAKKSKTAHSDDAGETPPLVDRRFYPPEMTSKRCAEYTANERPRPIEALNKALTNTRAKRDKIDVGDAVVHWFKMDLRVQDNHGLHAASRKARDKGASLICLYIICPQELEAHLTSPVKLDFMLRSLKIVQEDLAALDIPLYLETVEKRKDVPDRVLELCAEWRASHIYANVEY
jgi:deoxyribodipyrimidine photo-lyase